MIQIPVPSNRSEIIKEIQVEYQIIWEIQYNTNNKGQACMILVFVISVKNLKQYNITYLIV